MMVRSFLILGPLGCMAKQGYLLFCKNVAVRTNDLDIFFEWNTDKVVKDVVDNGYSVSVNLKEEYITRILDRYSGEKVSLKNPIFIVK